MPTAAAPTCSPAPGRASGGAPGDTTGQDAEATVEAQRAFGALMRSVQAGGALSEKARELILFSLVVHSRCEGCFEAHYRRALDMGITQAELDEAAWCAIAMGGAPVRMFYQDCLERARRS